MEIREHELWKLLERKSEGEKAAEQAFEEAVWQVCGYGITLSKTIRDTFQTYTLHDETHICNVMTIMLKLLGNLKDCLTKEECAMLIMSACCHDIGMSASEEEKEYLRSCPDCMQEYLDKLGFNEAVPFEINMSASKYSNGETIGTEIQLADSGYGQGQILVNPLHLACIYTAFRNGGNMVKPYLVYQEDAQPQQWISGAISTDTAGRVLEGLKGVVNDSEGTGYAARREDVLLAGKTGTAEIKDSKEDTTGTELGWFAVFSAGEDEENPILIVSMVEDVKERGGSGYVVEKVSQVLDVWFRKEYQGGKAAEGETP